ncbi:MAG: hypothetical protein QOG67_3359 [Verrucomicrobiota bacterium]|jgi:hypothetical protein
MKHPIIYSLLAAALVLLVGAITGFARPIDFSEVSLLVRSHESETSIKDEVSRRKLMHPLNAQQETALKSQGASDSLLQTLRSNNVLASKEEIAASESAHAQKGNANDRDSGTGHGAKVSIINVAYGHSINLSRWGGADYEIAFYSYRVAGEDYIQPALVDTVRTGTDVARNIPLISEGEAFTEDRYPTNETRNWRFTPYDAHGDLKDNRVNFSDSVAISSHSFSRPLQVDWENPITIEGQPYNFFPVYGAGGVSLYYIGKASDRSAKVAVVSRHSY